MDMNMGVVDPHPAPKKRGGDVLKEKEAKDPEGEADASQSIGRFPADLIGQPSPEESKCSRDGGRDCKKRGSPHLFHSKVYEISHMVDNDGVGTKYCEGGEKYKRPEAPCPH